MARVEVIKNFLSTDECATLNAWALQGVERKWLDIGFHEGGQVYDLRLTTRMYGDRFETPDLVHFIFDRIREFLSLPDAPIIEGHGKDGVVVSLTYPGGSTHAHHDPRPQSFSALRCNVVTQAPDDGGELWVAGKHIPVGVGDLHCYLVTEHSHRVTEVKGHTPRIVWMFGLCVPASDWESRKIQVGEFA